MLLRTSRVTTTPRRRSTYHHDNSKKKERANEEREGPLLFPLTTNIYNPSGKHHEYGMGEESWY